MSKIKIDKKPVNEILLKLKRIKIAKYIIFSLCVIGLAISLFWNNTLTKMINPNYFGANEYVYFAGEQNLQSPELKVHYIDVGCADCTFIELPDGKNMIIDCAGDILDKQKSVDAMMLYLQNNIFQEKQKKIDYLVITHADLDHIHGLDDLLKEYDVLNIIRPKVLSSEESRSIANYYEYSFATNYKIDYSEEYNKQIKAVYSYITKNEQTKMYFASSSLNFSTETYKLQFLTPNNEEYEQDNDYSCAIRLEYSNKSFMFMADCTSVGEEEILNNYSGDIEKLKTDFVKLGHHGSNTSSTGAFLNALQSDYYVTSTRAGVYSNVPSNEVFERVKNFNEDAKILRTDFNGNVLISVNSLGEFNVSTSQGSFYFVSHNVFIEWYYVAICCGVIVFILIFSIKIKSYEQMLQAKRDKTKKLKEKMLQEAWRLNNNE